MSQNFIHKTLTTVMTLRSSSSQSLLVPSFRQSTVGRRSFPVAASENQ